MVKMYALCSTSHDMQPCCASQSWLARVPVWHMLHGQRLPLSMLIAVYRDLAAHIDGFIATAAHTVVLSSEETVTGAPPFSSQGRAQS